MADDIKKAVIDYPKAEERIPPRASPIILSVAARSQSFTPWGYNFRQRDKELSAFWHTEPWMASVVYSVSIRNASFAWDIVGSDLQKTEPKKTIATVRQILKNSNFGKGWQNLIIKTCIDLYTRDSGAYWQLIRVKDSPDSPLVNIVHLDSLRCLRTGDPKYPVIYTDRKGKEHLLKWYQVRTIEEMPSPIEEAYNIGYCAVSRALLAAEIIQSISVYKHEKVSGTFTKAIDVISGVTQRDIDDALAITEEQNLNKNLYRYSLPVLLPGVDPSTTLSHVHIDLASLPDNFSEDTSLKWYIAQLAAAFGVDYQEIAPLMTGNLGSSQQSEIMHMKTRGKGPAMIMGLIEDILSGLLPANVRFKFLEQDIRSESEKAEARFTRAKDRSLRVKSGELDGKAARQIAVQDGDLPLWMAEEIDARGETEKEVEKEMGREEFQAEQIEGGIESQNTKEYIKQIRKAISENPDKFLQNRVKGSFGTPSGTVIARIYPNEEIKKVQSSLIALYGTDRARFVREEDFHITLVDAPLVDSFEFYNLASQVGFNPISVTANKVDYFDTPSGKVAYLAIEQNDKLNELHDKLVGLFDSHNLPTKEHWTPHITLGYLSQEPVPFYILPVSFVIDRVEFTREKFDSEIFVYALDYAKPTTASEELGLQKTTQMY